MWGGRMRMRWGRPRSSRRRISRSLSTWSFPGHSRVCKRWFGHTDFIIYLVCFLIWRDFYNLILKCFVICRNIQVEVTEVESDQELKKSRWENARPRSLEYYSQVSLRLLIFCSLFSSSLTHGKWINRQRGAMFTLYHRCGHSVNFLKKLILLHLSVATRWTSREGSEGEKTEAPGPVSKMENLFQLKKIYHMCTAIKYPLKCILTQSFYFITVDIGWSGCPISFT